MSYRFVGSCRTGPGWNCSSILVLFSIAVYKPVWHIPLLSVRWINSWWWTDELSETCKFSWQNKFVKLVHLVGFITKKFVTMHGNMNVKQEKCLNILHYSTSRSSKINFVDSNWTVPPTINFCWPVNVFMDGCSSVYGKLLYGFIDVTNTALQNLITTMTVHSRNPEVCALLSISNQLIWFLFVVVFVCFFW